MNLFLCTKNRGCQCTPGTPSSAAPGNYKNLCFDRQYLVCKKNKNELNSFQDCKWFVSTHIESAPFLRISISDASFPQNWMLFLFVCLNGHHHKGRKWVYHKEFCLKSGNSTYIYTILGRVNPITAAARN